MAHGNDGMHHSAERMSHGQPPMHHHSAERIGFDGPMHLGHEQARGPAHPHHGHPMAQYSAERIGHMQYSADRISHAPPHERHRSPPRAPSPVAPHPLVAELNRGIEEMNIGVDLDRRHRAGPPSSSRPSSPGRAPRALSVAPHPLVKELNFGGLGHYGAPSASPRLSSRIDNALDFASSAPGAHPYSYSSNRSPRPLGDDLMRNEAEFRNQFRRFT